MLFEKFRLHKDVFINYLIHNKTAENTENIYQFKKFTEVMDHGYVLPKQSLPKQNINLPKMERYLIKGKYPEELRPTIRTLTQYIKENIGLEYLEICTKNLMHITYKNLVNSPYQKDLEMVEEALGDGVLGQYNSQDNIMTIFENGSENHETLHLSSSPYTYAIVDDLPAIVSTGFYIIIPCYQICIPEKTDICFGVGFNEGCTEMFTRKIFNNENYDTDSYTIPVHIARMFELLYDDPQGLLKHYLTGNVKGPYQQFTKYGFKEDYFYLLKLCDQLMDYDEMTRDNAKCAENNLLCVLENAITRTNDINKINKFKVLCDEYFETKKRLGIDFDSVCIDSYQYELDDYEEELFDNSEEFDNDLTEGLQPAYQKTR